MAMVSCHVYADKRYFEDEPTNSNSNGCDVLGMMRMKVWLADVMYIEAAAQDLVATLSALSDQRTVVYVAYGRNCCAEYAFRQAATDWDVEEVSNGELHPAFRAPDVSVLRMTLRPV
jgi:hypothetical protein